MYKKNPKWYSVENNMDQVMFHYHDITIDDLVLSQLPLDCDIATIATIVDQAIAPIIS